MSTFSRFLHRVLATGRRAVPILFSRRALAVAILFWLPVGVFIGLADEVGEGDTLPFDRAILELIHIHISSPQLDPYVVALTNLGGVVGATTIIAGAALLLLGRGYRRSAAFVVAGAGGASLMNSILKGVFARDRPSLFERIVLENSYSFPSGHSMTSSALAFTAIVLAWRTRYRLPVLLAATLYFVGIAFTRLYLGVHYPTDVLAGWCISAAWVAAVYWALRVGKRKVPPSVARADEKVQSAS
jgi:membrane-associated phospholipid phosphatase